MGLVGVGLSALESRSMSLLAYVDDVPVASGAWRRSVEPVLGTTMTAEIKSMYVVP